MKLSLHSFAQKIDNTKENIYVIISMLLCCIGLLPFILLSQYNVPGASDDLFHAFFMNTRNYFSGVWHWYIDGYNGRYANAFFMQIPGRIFMYPLFGKIFPLFILTGLYCSLRFLVSSCLTTKSYIQKTLPIILLTYIVLYIPSVEQLYWYSGATVYTIPTILYIFLLGILIRHFDSSLTIKIIVLIGLLEFFIIGSNENWMAVTFFTIILFTINRIKVNDLNKSQWSVIILTCIFVLLLILAPGSSGRLGAESNSDNGNGNVLASFVTMFFHTKQYIFSWFGLGSLLIITSICLLVSHIEKPIFQNLSSGFLVITFFVFLLIGIFIMKFSLGHLVEIRERGLISIFIVTLFLLIIIVSRLLKKLNIYQWSNNTKYIILLVGLLFCFSESNNFQKASLDILTGTAKQDAEENLWIQDYLMNSTESEIYMPQFQHKSKTLYYLSLPLDEKSWEHWIATTYFHKKKILVDKSLKMAEYRQQHSRKE